MHQGRRGSNKDQNKLGRDTMKKPSPASSAVKKSGGMKRGPWTPEEDELLASYVKREGEGKWRTLPKRAGLLRCGKSCRLRWMNYLRPTVKRGQIGPDEEDLILRLHRLLGNRWSLIAGRIPGRTDNEIKNYWNTHLSKKLVSQGIDPRTHRPLNPSNHNTPTSTTNNDKVVLTAPNPNPSLEVHETNMISRSMTHDEDHFFHGNVTNLDGDCFPDDLLSSFLNSFMDEDIFQQQQQQEVNNSINNHSCSNNVCNNGSNNNVIAPPEPYFPAFGDENFWEDAAPSATALGGHDQHMDFVDQFNKFS